jgi:hypothetical protein
MATTTNFGWETPDDTDLVKDGAAAIRTALGGVDTSFVDLKGGTTGQVLAKASNTDLDYSWSTPGTGLTWVAFTPTFSGLTIGNGTVVARQATSNDYEALFIQVTFGSTTLVTGTIYVNTPTSGVIDYSFNTGTCAFFDTSSGNTVLGIASTGTDGGVQRVFPAALNSSSTYTTRDFANTTVPFTWATGDILTINIYYEF